MRGLSKYCEGDIMLIFTRCTISYSFTVIRLNNIGENLANNTEKRKKSNIQLSLSMKIEFIKIKNSKIMKIILNS